MLSIKELPTMSREDVIERSVRHVLKNGKPSVDATGRCVYSGIGCGAAPFLTPMSRKVADGKGRASAASCGWWTLVREGEVAQQHENLICLLQHCHDSAASTSYEGEMGFVEKYKKKLLERFPNDPTVEKLLKEGE